MTALLQQAIEAIGRMSAADQDAIATRLLAEVEDERNWEEKFRATTDGQWDRLADQIRRDVAEGRVQPLIDAFPSGEPAP